MLDTVPSSSTFPMLSGNGGEVIAVVVFVSNYYSVTYILNDRKVIA